MFLSWGPPHDPWGWANCPSDFTERFKSVDFPLRPNYSETPDPPADEWATPGPDYRQHVNQYQQGYYAMTADVDRCLGRLLDAIRQEGLENDTLLVFTSDHGEMFGSHGRRAKYIFYEEACRVPFLVRWPGHIRPGATDTLLSSVDIMPTLLGAMGLRVPRAAEGSDVSGNLLGRSTRGPEAVYMQGMGTTAAWQDGTEWRALRDHQYTYAIYHRDRRELLFDNLADPYQMKTLADDRGHRTKLAHYRAQLKGWMKQHNDTFENCTWYRDRWTQDRNIVNTASDSSQTATGETLTPTRGKPMRRPAAEESRVELLQPLPVVRVFHAATTLRNGNAISSNCLISKPNPIMASKHSAVMQS